ncbi:hypothetical protein I3843_07G196400 [Carya illinoinensis]|uniref:Uncharacterized protein n=1 Tax=Carya illinoinensis TaxID=32201 RepID=A0A8T1Q6E9_CARIL|nr:hypothetical protein CIPAW_07G200200 [Carya illinoinensis]KAG6705949.1 hypothetical protein I3842_07G202900 [Carya illinoinensis]KAG7972698.1 hypothetical protein I3843_07G196400 [Carya illinoinensis]
MRSSRIVFLSCLLSTAFYFCSPTLITTSSSFIELPAGRPSVRKLSMLSPYDKHKYHKVKIGEDQIKGSSTVAEGSMALKRTRSGQDNLDHEFVYHIDYHGVTTHPTPTPRHPKP